MRYDINKKELVADDNMMLLCGNIIAKRVMPIENCSDWREVTIEFAEAIKSKWENSDNIIINYEEEVERLIRQRYTLSEELAIHRQRFDKPEEFDVYNNYCEECKNQVKQLINETQG